MTTITKPIHSYTLPKSVDELLRILSNNTVHGYSDNEIKLIWLSYNYALRAHGNQVRDSGELYIYHPLEVSRIICNMGLDAETVAASFLHDVVEDTETSLQDITFQFGEKISSLVDGVTKLSKYEFPDKDLRDAAGIRKLFLAMISDVRVIIIKLADRLHNLRTLDSLTETRRKNIALETLEIYAPIAERLGIWNIKSELEDTSFRYLQPQTYADISQELARSRQAHEEILGDIVKKVKEKLIDNGFNETTFEVSGRQKHIYSIYKKMHTPKYEGKGLDRIYDKIGVRIIVQSVQDCYTVLGIIHSEWPPVPGEFDDYIGMKLPSGYQSLHTAVRYSQSSNDIVEFQIRTYEMHYSAEFGIAAHWFYKEKGESRKRDQFSERKITWLRQMLEEPQSEDPESFLALLKADVLQDRVYVFTPRGDIIDLAAGSTAIDFAYHVHTDIGHRCRGARVNGKLVPLYQELKTGDQVEILTAKRGGPSRDWLNSNLGLVKTQRARSKIKAWFKKQEDEQNLAQGRATLEREFQRLGLSTLNYEKMARELGFKVPDEMYIAIGTGDLPLNRVIRQIGEAEQTSDTLEITSSGQENKQSTNVVEVVGLKGLLSTMAKCCNPMPGDQIVGYITRGRGATIHRQDCPNVLHRKDKERFLQVGWGKVERTFPVPVTVKAYDRQGLMGDISTLLQNEGVNIADVSVNINRSLADLKLVLEVRDIAQLSRVLTRIESLPNVLEAARTKPG